MSHDDRRARSSSPGGGTHFDPSVVDAFLEISRVVRRLLEAAGEVNHNQAGSRVA
jgi:hypothetical protein